MNFQEYAQAQYDKSFRNKKSYQVRTFEPSEPIPHEPGSLSQQAIADRAGANEARTASSPGTGEVVGEDLASGESLVRQPGNRLVRVNTGQQSVPGQQVSVSSAKTETYERVRREGSVISQAITKSSGWERAEPVRTGFRGTASSSFTIEREVEDAGLIGDACTPPDVKLRILEDAIANGLYLDAQGNIIGGITQGVGPWGDVLAGYDVLNDVYEEAKRADKQQQSLPTFLSLDSLGGSSTLDTEFTPGVPLFWDCVDGTCVQSEQGVYPTKELCAQACRQTSVSCVNGTCVEVDGLTGRYKTLAECLAAGCSTRYDCIGGECVPTPDGEFQTLDSCQASGCFWGYNCVGGECVPAVGGAFKTLTCCEQNCQPLGPATAYLVSTNSPQGTSRHVLEGAAAAVPPLSGNQTYNVLRRNFDPNSPMVATFEGDAPRDPALLVLLNERKVHTMTVECSFDSPNGSLPLNLLSHFVFSQYFPVFGVGFGAGGQVASFNPLTDFYRDTVQRPVDFGTGLTYFQVMEGYATYSSAVDTLEQVFAAMPIDTEPLVPYSGVFYGEGTYAELGYELEPLGSTTGTVTEITPGVYRYEWSGVVLRAVSDTPGSEFLVGLEQTIPSQPWKSADQGFCQSAVATNSFTGLNDALRVFTPSLVFPGPHWQEDWAAYTVTPVSSIGVSRNLSITFSSQGDPLDLGDFFTGYTHPSTPATFYPWSSQRNQAVWTDPKYSPNSVGGAAVTGCL